MRRICIHEVVPLEDDSNVEIPTEDFSSRYVGVPIVKTVVGSDQVINGEVICYLPIKYQDRHGLKYGLKITARDSSTFQVTSIVRQFCAAFGREDNNPKKRKMNQSIKYYRAPFQTDHYGNHID